MGGSFSAVFISRAFRWLSDPAVLLGGRSIYHHLLVTLEEMAGGFVLGEHQSISVLQAISLAEGLNVGADARHARILRLKRDADQREELTVDVKDVLNGKKPDVALQGDDILFIPGSTGKKAALRTLEAAIQTGTGMAIWRVP